MVVSPYTNDINKIIVQLNIGKDTAIKNGDNEALEWFEIVLEIVKEWKYDNSQWDFRQNHYRQAVSFLMRLAEEYGSYKHQMPEYFEDTFFDLLQNYKALEHRFNERFENGKKEIENNEKK